MKFLLLLVVLWVGYALWRAQRIGGRRGDSAPGTSQTTQAAPGSRSAGPGTPQDMVQCPVCHLHLPRGDAVADSQGRFYCGPQHRDQAGR